jgi:hypothetical protein
MSQYEEVAWEDFVRQILSTLAHAGLTVALGGNPLSLLGDAAIDLILKEILGLESAETRVLQAIEGKVDLLVRAPYNKGIVYLAEANKPYLHGNEKQEYIRKAEDEFMQAYAQEKELKEQFRLAIIQYHVATCFLLRRKRRQASDWFNRSYASAVEALKEWHEQSNRRARTILLVNGREWYEQLNRNAQELLLSKGKEHAQLARNAQEALLFRYLEGIQQQTRVGERMSQAIEQQVEKLYVALNPETRAKGKRMYDFLVALRLLEKSPRLGLHMPSLSSSFSEGIFNVTQFEDSSISLPNPREE